LPIGEGIIREYEAGTALMIEISVGPQQLLRLSVAKAHFCPPKLEGPYVGRRCVIARNGLGVPLRDKPLLQS